MNWCNLLRYKKKTIFVHILILVSLEWVLLTLYISTDSNLFPQNIVLDLNLISNGTNKTKIRNGHLQSTARTTTFNYSSVQNCTKKEVKLSETKLPVTGLVGFPGSGSTWLRHLVQQLTGIGTSSMYCDGKLKKNGFPFECLKNLHQTVLVKTHEEIHFKVFTKVVLLIRNPYEALLSYFSWTKGGHTGQPMKKSLLEVSKKQFNSSLWWYVDIINGSLTRFKGPVHLVQYERLKTDMANELGKLTSFLQVNVTNNDIGCAVRLQEGKFHRKRRTMEHLDILRTLYDREKLQRLKTASDTVQALIKHVLNLNVDVSGTIEKELLHKT